MKFGGHSLRLCLLLCMAAPMIPATAAPAAQSVYPLLKDASWTYQVTTQRTGKQAYQTYAVINVEEVGRYKYYDIAKGKSARAAKIYLSEDAGRFFVDGYEKKLLITDSNVWFDPSPALFSAPLQPGRKARTQLTARGFLLKRSVCIEAEVIATEKIVTPAGIFEALRVHISTTGRHKTRQHDIWFVPGVGIAKYTGPQKEAILTACNIPKQKEPRAQSLPKLKKNDEAHVQFTGFSGR